MSGARTDFVHGDHHTTRKCCLIEINCDSCRQLARINGWYAELLRFISDWHCISLTFGFYFWVFYFFFVRSCDSGSTWRCLDPLSRPSGSTHFTYWITVSDFCRCNFVNYDFVVLFWTWHICCTSVHPGRGLLKFPLAFLFLSLACFLSLESRF